jgi:hypothetical protein
MYYYFGDTQGEDHTLTGNVIYHSIRNCPGNYMSDTIQSQDCVCTETTDTDNNVSCGPGYAGHATRTRQWRCGMPTASGGQWDPWGAPDISGCSCNAGTENRVNQCPAHFTGTGTPQTRTTTCSGGEPTIGNWVDSGPTDCTCQPTTEFETVGCQTKFPGKRGNIVKSRTFDCSLTPPAWVQNPDDESHCAAGTHIWATGSAQQGSAQTANPHLPLVGNACSPPDSGSCASIVPQGYVIYPTCACN